MINTSGVEIEEYRRGALPWSSLLPFPPPSPLLASSTMLVLHGCVGFGFRRCCFFDCCSCCCRLDLSLSLPLGPTGGSCVLLCDVPLPCVVAFLTPCVLNLSMAPNFCVARIASIFDWYLQLSSYRMYDICLVGTGGENLHSTISAVVLWGSPWVTAARRHYICLL